MVEDKIQEWVSSLPLFQDLNDDSKVDSLRSIADNIRSNFKDIVILATGGSTLTGQALMGMNIHGKDAPNLHFLDNIDPKTFQEKVLSLDFEKTFFIVISKSGQTMETLAQAVAVLTHFPKNLDISRHFLAITENKENALRELANHNKWPILDHPEDIGGRYAGFTLVGLLPCMLLGLDPIRFKEGARSVIKNITDIIDQSKETYKYFPINQHILCAYSDYAQNLMAWQAQLIGESLGKKDMSNLSKGITPIISRGTIDQHSQLQLWLDGPKDRIFTVYFFNSKTSLQPLQVDPILQHKNLKELQGLQYSSIFKAQCMATVEALRQVGYKVFFKAYENLDEYTAGQIMMERIIDVLSLSVLMEVNPFDQPAVEMGKKLVRAYL